MGNELFTQVDLLHADTEKVVVRVSCINAGVVTAALGEAPGAEEAEDRALARLQQRLAHTPRQSQITAPAQRINPEPIAEPIAEVINEPIQEPEDWSDELTAVELELQRLGWDRHQEGIYLQRAFALASRNRLVNYADLVIYLKALRTLEPPCSAATAAIPLLRAAMLKASDQLLSQLQWGADQGRSFLAEHFGHSSRLQLSDDQLQQFNGLLQKQLQQEPINFVAPQTA
ncbi:MAG: hypothetical protein RLZZ89_749 [Cyanobacteriota bacterium]